MFHSQCKCPLTKGNYRPENGTTKSDKEILIHSSVTSLFSSMEWRQLHTESIEEEEKLLKRLWVLSHYRLLRRTCCEHTAVARESQKTGKVLASNVLVIWLKILELTASQALMQHMNNLEIQRSCTWNKSNICQNCMDVVQMVIITLLQQPARAFVWIQFFIHWLPDMSLLSESVLTVTFPNWLNWLMLLCQFAD